MIRSWIASTWSDTQSSSCRPLGRLQKLEYIKIPNAASFCRSVAINFLSTRGYEGIHRASFESMKLGQREKGRRGKRERERERINYFGPKALSTVPLSWIEFARVSWPITLDCPTGVKPLKDSLVKDKVVCSRRNKITTWLSRCLAILRHNSLMYNVVLC